MQNSNSKQSTAVISIPTLSKLNYTRKEGAAWLGVSVRTIDNLIKIKALRTQRIGSRVLIPVEALEEFRRISVHSTQVAA